MNSDDLIQELPDEKTTQPMISDLFRLIEELKQRMEVRADATDRRLDAIESRLAVLEGRQDAVEGHLGALEVRGSAVEDRLVELSAEVKDGSIRVSDRIGDMMEHVNTRFDSEYEDLRRRMRKVESKAS